MSSRKRGGGEGDNIYNHLKAISGNLMDLNRLINDDEIELALHTVELIKYHTKKVESILREANKGVK